MLKMSALQYLKNWKDKKIRKPFVIRGARQVGKSYLVRIFAKEAGLDFMEINLELRLKTGDVHWNIISNLLRQL